jgi:cobalt/nickel transport system ATP-binding protein
MLIEFEGVRYTYPCSQEETLLGLSFKITEGKKYALIGHNGCGKTTLFRLANGLYRPHQGIVRWRGNPLKYNRTFLTQLRQQVGLVFQNPEQQLVATTVEEDLSYGLCNLGLPEELIAERIQETLKNFNLIDLADYPVNYLSLGQKKRVAIADVMILKPKLLLLDEPTAYLDPRQTREFLQQLEQIYQEGTTILLATHDLDFVCQWADWLLVMNQGKLILEGTPQTVFNQRELLEELELGVPLALDLIEQVKAIITEQQNLNSLSSAELDLFLRLDQLTFSPSSLSKDHPLYNL